MPGLCLVRADATPPEPTSSVIQKELPRTVRSSQSWCNHGTESVGPVAARFTGNQVVVLSGDSTCETLKLPAATSAETAADALSLAITGDDVPGGASDDEDEELQKLKVPPGQWHGSTKVDLAAKAQVGGANQTRVKGFTYV